MTDITELINVPRQIVIGGQKLNIRQLKLKELFGYLAKRIYEERYSEAEELCKRLGINGADKNKFMLEATGKIPKGSLMTMSCSDRQASYEGVVEVVYLASKDVNDGLNITPEYISNLISPSDMLEIAPMLLWINGTDILDKKNKENKEDEGNAEDTEDTEDREGKKKQ